MNALYSFGDRKRTLFGLRSRDEPCATSGTRFDYFHFDAKICQFVRQRFRKPFNRNF